MARQPKQTDAQRTEIAALVRQWRDRAGISCARAAEILGMSRRTYEGIEQGRGFAYPTLLIVALQHYASDEKKRPAFAGRNDQKN